MLYKYLIRNTIKGKFVFVLCTCHLGIRDSGGIAPLILNLGTRWRLVVSFLPRPHYPPENNHGVHRIWGWVDHRVGLDVLKKRKYCKRWRPFHMYKRVCVKDLLIPLNKLTHFHITHHRPERQCVLWLHVTFSHNTPDGQKIELTWYSWSLSLP
jgi:hypothetical protein